MDKWLRLWIRLGFKVMLIMTGLLFCMIIIFLLSHPKIQIQATLYMKVKQCLYNGCCIAVLILGATLIVLQLFFLEGLIRSQAEQGIVMTNDTYGLWGNIPGDTETFTVRNFTMFNFTNPHKFIYQGNTTPEFTEIGGFLYQQNCQFIDYFYTEDDTKVHYNYWLYFDLLNNSKNVQAKYTVINVAPLGFWMQLDTVPITTFTLQGFGGLFVEMNNTIKMQAIGQGVSQTFLKTYDIFALLCADLLINEKFCWYLWNDRYYGLDNEVNMQFWVKAAYYRDQETKDCLFQHFYPIPAIQFEALLLEIRDLAEGVTQILQNWFCRNDPAGEKCDSYKFTIKQISAAGITNDPPPGSAASQSICSSNSTCVGSPEIVTFLHHQFKAQYPDEKYQRLTFREQTFRTLFTPYQGLLNIGTINEIYKYGGQLDQTHKPQDLQKLAQLLNAESPDHAFVIWEWIKYMTQQFVLKMDRGGSRKIAGLGGVFSQAWYQVTFSFADWFLRDVYSFLAFREIGQDCLKHLSFLPQDTATLICKQSIPDPTNYTSFYSLIQPCLNLTNFSQFQAHYNISPTTMQQYCDIDQDPSNIGLLTIKILEIVHLHYGCKENLPTRKCTQWDIIVKQIFGSQITLKPLDIVGYRFYNKPTITANDWNPQIPTFEYKHYLKLAGIEDVQQHLQSQARDLFTFDKLLNGPEVQQLFITDNDIDFYHKYHWINPPYLRNYMRYVVMEVGFGGFTQQRSPREIFFGYVDPFLQNLKETDTMAGGDPSINSLIAFNELNLTREQAKINNQVMYTGKDDTSKTRQFVSLYGKTFIAVNSSYYDGKEIRSEMVTPWAEQVPLQGSDGFSIPPNLEKEDAPPIYISSIARFANVKYKQSIRKYDMQLWDMRISEDALQSAAQNPANAKYYQYLHCFLNSSYQGFPLFVSKNHFLDADSKWGRLANIRDERGNMMVANDWDDTRLYVEPYTGTAFSATVYLQSNYYYQPNDILYPSSQFFRSQAQSPASSADKQARMLPIVNTFRSGNISANAVDKYFGDLRDIINNKRKVALTGWFIISLAAIVWLSVRVCAIVNFRKLRDGKGEKRSLLESQTYEN